MKAPSTTKPEQSRHHGSSDRGGHGQAHQAMAVPDSRPEMAQQQSLLSLMAGSPRLQRKCACGAPSAAGGSCAACEGKQNSAKPVLLQKQLAIGAADDPLEREADRVADQVMAAPAHPSVRSVTPRIQRLARQGGATMATAPASVERVLGSPGRPLERSLREDMEQRFGYDFSSVRVHSGAQAELSAQEVNANAYTVGSDIVFNRGRFSPETQDGKHLLAHELAHVVQQGGNLNMGLLREVDQKDLERCMASLGDTTQRGKGFIVDRDAGVASASEIDQYRKECTARLESADREKKRNSRIADALKRSGKYGNLGQEIINILSDPVLQISVTISIAAYLSLWVVPEPLISKLTAILTTIAILSVGGFSASAIYNLAQAWMRLEKEAGDAQSDQEIEAAAEHFGKSITEIEAQVLVFLASIVIGKALPGPKGRLPPPDEAMLNAAGKFKSAGTDGVVVEFPGGRATAARQTSVGASDSSPPRAVFSGSNALKIETVSQPALRPGQAPMTLPAPAKDNVIPLRVKGVTSKAPPPVSKPVLPVIPGSGSVPRPDMDVDLDRSRNRRGCKYEVVGQQFGRYPCHADYARHLSGVSREVRITSQDGESVDFDAMDAGGILYEVKTGYRSIAFAKDSVYMNTVAMGFWAQAERQIHVAGSCGHPLKWYFNDPYAASFFGARNSPYPNRFGAPLPAEVWYEPFDCNVDG
jgi:hypothetical protein